MKPKTLLSILAITVLQVLTGISAIESPLQVRVASKVMEDYFQRRAQRIPEGIQNVKLETTGDICSDMKHIQQVEFSVQNYMNASMMMSLEVDKFGAFTKPEDKYFKVKGKVMKANGQRFDFIYALLFSNLYKMDTEKQQGSQKVVFQERLSNIILLDDQQFNHQISQDENKELKECIQKFGKAYKKILYEGTTAGDQSQEQLEFVKDFPKEVLLPYTALYNLVKLAETYQYDGQLVHLGYSAQTFHKFQKADLKGMKTIKHEFNSAETQQGASNPLVQVSLDDNFFTQILLMIANHKQSYRLREIAKMHEKLEGQVGHLTTTKLGMVLAEFKTQFGDNKNLDVKFSFAHSEFKNGVSGAKMSSVNMDKNGNWKIRVNLLMTLFVEQEPGVWEQARDLYITVTGKFKLRVNDTDPANKRLGWTPRQLEISKMRIMHGDQEMDMEQMMMQSVINIQLENIQNKFREFDFPLSLLQFKAPKEINCFGVKISDFDLAYQKALVQATLLYQEEALPSEEFCSKFFKDLVKTPKQFLNRFDNANRTQSLHNLFDLIKKVKKEWTAKLAKKGVSSGKVGKEETQEKSADEGSSVVHEDL